MKSYGFPPALAEPTLGTGLRVNEKRAARLMREDGIQTGPYDAGRRHEASGRGHHRGAARPRQRRLCLRTSLTGPHPR
jgi:transposase InsO family protein